MNVMQRLTAWLGRLVTQPIDELSRVQRTMRFAMDLSRHCAGELARNQATQMAAALTYRTIFSLVPMAMLMLLVFRAFGGFEQVSEDLQGKIYQYLGLSSIVLPADDADTRFTVSGQDNGDESRETQRQLRASIEKIMTDLVTKASDVKVARIGVIGLPLLIWAALALLITVERSFNQIFGTPTGRAWHLRVPIYWAAITLGPVLLFVSLYVAQSLVDSVQHWATVWSLPVVLSGLIEVLSRSMALAASWLLLFLLYVLMPNTRVRLRSALVGALVAAGLWELGKWGFKLYMTKAVSFSVLYGALGLVPLFLLWIYLTWLIVLFGLEITYTLQAMRGREFEKRAASVDRQSLVDPQWLVLVMVAIGQTFRRGGLIDLDTLAVDLELPVRAVTEMGQQLHTAGLVHTVDNGSDPHGLTLARPPEDILVTQLLELGQSLQFRGHGQHDGSGGALLEQLANAQLEIVSGLTLAELLK